MSLKDEKQADTSPPVIWLKFDRGLYIQCSPGSFEAFPVVPKKYFDSMVDQNDRLFSTIQILTGTNPDTARSN